MQHTLKSSDKYLSQFKNDQNEKTGVWVNEISRYLEEGVAGESKFKLLEVGPGGGFTIEFLKKTFKDRVDITAVDVSESILNSLKKRIEISTTTESVGDLPFKNNYFQGINASSVFHEIFSYGLKKKSGEKLIGLDAVKTAFLECLRVLKPGGLLFYRDILSPDAVKTVAKVVLYKRESWHHFIEWFLPNFIDTDPRYYSSKISQNKSNKGLSINTAIGVHKEIQKHYINFAHYLKYEMGNEIGFTVNDFGNNKTTKSKKFKLGIDDPKLNKIAAKIGEETSKGDFVVNKQNLEDFIDILLTAAFSKPEYSWIKTKGKFSSWMKREGGEHYVYLSVLELLDLLEKLVDENGFVLYPIDNTDCKLHIRFKYNSYLRRTIDFPELDGTQVILLRKIMN